MPSVQGRPPPPITRWRRSDMWRGHYDQPVDRGTAELALRLTDLTDLDPASGPAEIVALCARARRPDPDDPRCPSVAAVCVYPRLTAVAAGQLAGSGIAVAAVAGAFPSGLAPVAAKVAEAAAALAAGATEIDLTIDRQAFLSGRQQVVSDEVAAVRSVCGPARLKVILETGELKDPALIRAAADLAISAGADMVKTSTGKCATGANPEAARILLEAALDFQRRHGRSVGVKISGGVRTVTDAAGYLDLAEQLGGRGRLQPQTFRFGASALVDALVAARREAPPAGNGR